MMQRVVLAWFGCLMVTLPVVATAQAAITERVAKVIDFSQFPMAEGAEKVNHAVLASQSYTAKGTVEQITADIQKRLQTAGWQALPSAMVTPAYANSTYQKQGFHVNLTVMPGSEAGTVGVNLINFGDVPLSSLPLPDGFQETFASPAMRMAAGDAAVDDVQAAMQQALVADGWTPYGETAGSFFVKRGTVQLRVSVMSSPAQGKTIMQLSTVQLSADLPAPADAIGLQYSDVTQRLSFESPQPAEAVFAFYRETLGNAGWKPTTDQPIAIQYRKALIFRNDAQELVEVEIAGSDDKPRVTVKYMSAAAVEAENHKVQAMAAKAKDEAAKPAAAIVIQTPPGAKVVRASDKSVEFSIASGKARASVAQWLKDYQDQKWAVTTNIAEPIAGDYTFEKGNQRLHVTYTDPGFIPASITISTTGAEELVIRKD